MWPCTQIKLFSALCRERHLAVVLLVVFASACSTDSAEPVADDGPDGTADTAADTNTPGDDAGQGADVAADTDREVDTTGDADDVTPADDIADADTAADTIVDAITDAAPESDATDTDAIADVADPDAPDAPEVPTDWDVCARIVGTTLATCIEEQLRDPELAYRRGGRQQAHARCTDAEPAAAAWDAWCASPDAEAFACGSGFEAWYDTTFPACRRELRDWNYDRTCVFGPRWNTQDLEPAIREVYRRWFTDAAEYTDLDARQLVRAVQLAGSSEVTTLAGALGSIDSGEARKIVLWDASVRRTWVLWEFGRGDNSYGAWFAADDATAVARVADGDTYDCAAFYGPEMRECLGNDDCAAGARCVGTVEPFAGRCVNLTLDPPDLATPCNPEEDASCGEDSALLCSGATNDFVGQCRPAWMRGNYGTSPELSADDSDPQGLRSQLVVTGLTTVSTDVNVRLVLQHPDMSQVSLTLTNPAGTSANLPIPDGVGSYLVLEQQVEGIPGDEAVNGIWTLTVFDNQPDGQAAYLQEWTLRLGSRWD
ncbi:MAG: proprotein convertase P-domain-containing protein [Myxococcales bacterium]|nr:proprotein convertase P-domain-containing protein [Myxococcales bacterium]